MQDARSRITAVVAVRRPRRKGLYRTCHNGDPRFGDRIGHPPAFRHPAENYAFDLPRLYPFDGAEDIIRLIDLDHQGQLAAHYFR